jgi:energy-coupling factor transporter ATP-binding protein EcfA2
VHCRGGCGKTTLLRIIAGLEIEYEGNVFLDGKKLFGPGLDRGVVFQEHMVELHVGIWEDMTHHIPLEEPALVLNNPKFKEWGGLRIPVLSEEDALLLQVLQAFQHMVSYWVKLSWLLEIGRFIEKRGRDSPFWKRFSRQSGGRTAACLVLDHSARIVGPCVFRSCA